MMGSLSSPLYLVILFCRTLIKRSPHYYCHAWLVSPTFQRNQASRFLVRRLASNHDDDDDEIDSRWRDLLDGLPDDSSGVTGPLQSLQDLKNSIRSESRNKKISTSRQFQDKKYLQSKDFALNPDSLSQLEGIFGKEQLFSDIDDDDDDKELGNESSNVSYNDDDAVFLDAETYLQYSILDGGQEDFRNGFTSMDFDINQRASSSSSMSIGNGVIDLAMPPDAPYYSGNNADEEVTLADILALKQTMAQRQPPSPEEERAIFEEVFRDEKAYFEDSSSIFREGLTNRTAAQMATFMRRNKQYRKNLLKELNKLEKQIQDFEVLLENEERLGSLEQSKDDGKEEAALGSVLEKPSSPIIGESETLDEFLEEDEDETDFALEESDDPVEEWLLVDDPSTGEVFFWNSVTGEMKVSLHDEDDW